MDTTLAGKTLLDQSDSCKQCEGSLYVVWQRMNKAHLKDGDGVFASLCCTKTVGVKLVVCGDLLQGLISTV